MKNLILATMISFVAGAAVAGELNTNGCRVAWTDATLTIDSRLSVTVPEKLDFVWVWVKFAR